MIQPWRGGGPANANRATITNSNFAGEVGVNGNEQLDGLEHMLAMTVTDTGSGAEVRYFIDGLEVGSTAVGTVRMSDLSNELAYIGRSLYNDPAIVGSINEVRIYNDALSSGDIMTNFSNGPNGNPVPEPAAVGIALLGMATLATARRRQS
jgi:hypothetical protein